MTGLAADVASLATGLGAVAGDMTRLVAIIAALHRKATGIVAALRAAARHVTSLVAIVTTQLRSLSEKTLCNCESEVISMCRNAEFLSLKRSTAGKTLEYNKYNKDLLQTTRNRHDTRVEPT